MKILHNTLDRFEAWRERNGNLYFALVIFGIIASCSIADTMMEREETIIIAERNTK